MAAEAVAVSRWHQIVTFVRESYHEIRDKTTWPDFPQVRQASIAIVVFVLVIGLFITLLDAILKGLLINLIPSLFR
jgi:preprotein translocase subunit SecE